MARILIIIFTLFLSQTCEANRIDSLRTKNQVDSFITKYVPDQQWRLYKFRKNRSDTFYRADFDRNGLADIILTGEGICVVIDSGSHYYSFCVNDLYKFASLIETDSATYIHTNVYANKGLGFYKKNEALIFFKNGSFIEYSAVPSKQKIDKVIFDFMHGFCFDCNSYVLEINSDLSAKYISDTLNAQLRCTDTLYATKKISKETYSQISDLLNYLVFENLDNSYAYMATDLPEGLLTIFYNDGEVKRISDYGLSGTLGLAQLYDMLEAIYVKPNWDIRCVHGPGRSYK